MTSLNKAVPPEHNNSFDNEVDVNYRSILAIVICFIIVLKFNGIEKLKTSFT